ncbi:MAG: hypothetical protein M1825_002852 [Sarcosagium campestre]|nr:MAG: hypothetical protein M1825_002852 [Sarcosagium campestre]
MAGLSMSVRHFVARLYNRGLTVEEVTYELVNRWQMDIGMAEVNYLFEYFDRRGGTADSDEEDDSTSVGNPLEHPEGDATDAGSDRNDIQRPPWEGITPQHLHYDENGNRRLGRAPNEAEDNALDDVPRIFGVETNGSATNGSDTNVSLNYGVEGEETEADGAETHGTRTNGAENDEEETVQNGHTNENDAGTWTLGVITSEAGTEVVRIIDPENLFNPDEGEQTEADDNTLDGLRIVGVETNGSLNYGVEGEEIEADGAETNGDGDNVAADNGSEAGDIEW